LYELVLQKPLVTQQQQQQQQQRMPNGAYRGRGDPRHGRGRNDGPHGRGYRGGRTGRGMPYGPPMETPPNAAANHRSNEFSHDAARPQRTAHDGSAPGQGQGQGQGRGVPIERGNTRGGAHCGGRGGRGGGNVQKVYAAKPAGDQASAGKLPART